jgi:hypothetical protein
MRVSPDVDREGFGVGLPLEGRERERRAAAASRAEPERLPDSARPPLRMTWDSAGLDGRILAMRKYARWPGLPTDLEPSCATGCRAKQPRGRRDRSRRERAACPASRCAAGFGWQRSSDRTIASTSAPAPSLPLLRRVAVGKFTGSGLHYLESGQFRLWNGTAPSREPLM